MFQNWSCNSRVIAVLCLVLLCGGSVKLFAQKDVDISTSLDEFEVLGQIKPDPVFKNILLDTGLMQSVPAISFDQILKYQTNLYVRDYGSGALSSVSFRGFSSRHTAVFWEDMPVTSSMSKTFDGGLFPTFMAEEVSIQYGAAGMINGTGGLGGTIKLNANPEFKKGEVLKFEQSITSINNASTGIMYRRSNSKFINSTHFSATDAREAKLRRVSSDADAERAGSVAINSRPSGRPRSPSYALSKFTSVLVPRLAPPRSPPSKSTGWRLRIGNGGGATATDAQLKCHLDFLPLTPAVFNVSVRE